MPETAMFCSRLYNSCIHTRTRATCGINEFLKNTSKTNEK
jgi:hypothetical protein